MRYNAGMLTPAEEPTQAAETSPRQRQTERLKLSIPIRVMSFGGSAGDFVENTCTIIINRDGALIALKHRVAPDETLRIINLENFREADFRVVGEVRLQSEEYLGWGVECLEKERTLWDIEFPPPLDPAGLSAAALLECLGCGKQGLLVLNLVEVELLESAGTLQKLCDRCGHLATWSYADVTRRPKEIPPAAPQAPVSPVVGKWDGKVERRLYKRMAVKLRALVRNSKGDEEIVKTENLSKGGLALCLKMQLSLGEFVSVICPYSGGVQEFERKAEVRYRAPHVAGQNWFYGLRYFRE
ncbi:MAG: PilZ domain-containing protein [Acidobacteriia bacterium]|nr:PilZ domain-containing protein [Terriglobia bacterium]